jgi:(E)-4-hydroxy-3-methylbut-2-enyl-diphosphate synthase
MTRQVRVRDVAIGGSAPVSVQSMTKTDTADVAATLRQVEAMAAAGADLVRVAVPKAETVEAFGRICSRSPVPIIADIHFDHRLAIAAAEAGAAKLRINPGNIGPDDRVRAVVEAARAREIPMRIGVNAGSLESDLVERHGRHAPEALCESAVRNVERLEAMGFRDLVVSIKASDVRATIQANRLFAKACDVPLHLGVTEAGLGEAAVVKSAVGIGSLLAEGIGDTLRVSLTDEPVREVEVGLQILRSLGLRPGPQLVSCPTCARTKGDLAPLARELERGLRGIEAPIVVALMGCEVNGPGEAKTADVGVAMGRGSGTLFRRGEIVRRVAESEIVSVLLHEARQLDAAYDGSTEQE